MSAVSSSLRFRFLDDCFRPLRDTGRHELLPIIMSCVDGSLFARILFCFGVVVRYSLVSGLFARCLLPLALMVSANKVLFRFADNYVLDINQVFPIPGLTGSPSHHIVLTFSKPFQSSSIFTVHTTSPVVI